MCSLLAIQKESSQRSLKIKRAFNFDIRNKFEDGISENSSSSRSSCSSSSYSCQSVLQKKKFLLKLSMCNYEKKNVPTTPGDNQKKQKRKRKKTFYFDLSLDDEEQTALPQKSDSEKEEEEDPPPPPHHLRSPSHSSPRPPPSHPPSSLRNFKISDARRSTEDSNPPSSKRKTLREENQEKLVHFFAHIRLPRIVFVLLMLIVIFSPDGLDRSRLNNPAWLDHCQVYYFKLLQKFLKSNLERAEEVSLMAKLVRIITLLQVNEDAVGEDAAAHDATKDVFKPDPDNIKEENPY